LLRSSLGLGILPEKRETIDEDERTTSYRATDRRLRSIGCAELENNRMRITRKRKKRKKPGEEDGSEARMQNRARAGARPSMMAWFATMVMMLLALVNACIVVNGFVVSLNMHRHDTRVKEMRTHDVTARSSGGGAIGFDDGEDICNDDDCMMTTTNTLDAEDDEASVNNSLENDKSTARDKCLAHSDIIANVLFNLGYTRHINYTS